ncbi:hypothetical protein AB0N81_11920 [Streptomyces sp. NPDC093510]|uniref:hypothetical protein n=1 Tax=Streptomyces sp. NPDC093510 TaxID=3155199 RepID=UPI0034162126
MKTISRSVPSTPFSPDAAAEVLGNTSAVSRKLASRARARVAGTEEPPGTSRAEVARVLEAFKAAADAGDIAGRRPVHGAETIALLMIRQASIRRPGAFRVIEVNARPALATYRGGELVWLDTVEITDGRITTYRRLAKPEKLAGLRHI